MTREARSGFCSSTARALAMIRQALNLLEDGKAHQREAGTQEGEPGEAVLCC